MSAGEPSEGNGSRQREDGRTARSRATRTRIARAAGALFVTSGYAETSVQTVAEHAGVGTQTVYYTFGTKAAVLTAALDLAVAGDDEPVPTLDRAWVVEALSVPDAGEQIRRQAAGTADVFARVAPLLSVVRGAAHDDAEIAGVWRTNVHQRLTVQRAFADALDAKGALRPGMSVDTAAETSLALLGPEIYTLFTGELGWSPQRWVEWATDGLRRHLTTLESEPSALHDAGGR
ncbi:TetR/AcrR family transcriptional regulator [Spiractinospora alimapuensis]|uniref:TetR/AcrR family transcriptional regulator n=1 Tax=Spiractinospora alimapuensis TaxID=2820884 RepID=UPI001F29DE80|nr:TetR/AcrR family transcriptional regulator [Spiractinospora alimapuensis]QVQ52725.1 TetR/AcrR family transcriptional regulator [Spiractinospora alimapuensis]